MLFNKANMSFSKKRCILWFVCMYETIIYDKHVDYHTYRCTNCIISCLVHKHSLRHNHMYLYFYCHRWYNFKLIVELLNASAAYLVSILDITCTGSWLKMPKQGLYSVLRLGAFLYKYSTKNTRRIALHNSINIISLPNLSVAILEANSSSL